MKTVHVSLGILSLGMILSCSSLSQAADDAAAALAKAPAAVQTTTTQTLAGKKLEEFGAETLDGATYYEAGWKENEVDHAAIIDAKGKLMQTEADTEVAKLPQAVTDAIKKAHPDGKVSEAAMATSEGKHFYSIDMKVGETLHVLSINPDGKLTADQVEVAVAAK